MENSPFKTIAQKISESVTLKVIIIGILALLLLIPTVMVEGLIEDRIHFKQEAEREVTNSWGGAQQLNGPFLTIPYTRYIENSTGEIAQVERLLHVSPQNLMVNNKLKKEDRQLSIYEISLYKSTISLSGNFNIDYLMTLDTAVNDIHFEEAYLEMGLSDPAGINKNIYLIWEKESQEFKSGIPSREISDKGIHVPVNLFADQNKYEFSFELNLNGSGMFTILPVGKETEVNIESDWPDPGFIGNYLPEHNISDSGFDAKWNIFHLSRDIPLNWIGERKWDNSSAFGVNLVQMVDEYQKNMRSIKYSFLIICLTFLTFFLSELISKKPIHPFQYIMVGFALVIFYVLLISVSEHLGFDFAYLISSILTGGLVSLYLKAIFSSIKTAGIYALFFGVVYGLSYVILQMEGFSLLIGAVSLFIAIGATMYLTRNIDWYNIKANTPAKE